MPRRLLRPDNGCVRAKEPVDMSHRETGDGVGHTLGLGDSVMRVTEFLAQAKRH